MSEKKRNRRPFILAYGGEDYLLDRVLDWARHWEGHFAIELDGDGLAEAELVSICEERAFDGEPLVVVLDNAHKLKTGKAFEALVAGLSKDPSVTVVGIFRAEKLPAPWSDAAAIGQVKHYPRFKPWQEDKIQDRILDEAARLGLDLEADVPNFFLKLLGDNLRRTVNELRKLSHLVSGRKITRKDVASIIAADLPAEPYEVAEAATSKDPKTALRLVSILFKNMGDGASVPITSALMRQVEKLILARQMSDRGDAPDVIALRLDIHKFLLVKSILPRAQKFTVPELLSQMKRLCELESRVKGAARSKRSLVELAVLSIAA